MDGKYPTHKPVGTGKKPSSKEGMRGSASLADRVVSYASDRASANPAAGKERLTLKNGSRGQSSMDINHSKGIAESAPGHNEPKILSEKHDGIKRVTSGFKAHSLVAKNGDKNSMLRFSGNSGAHRIGSKASGKFNKENYHTQGLPNVATKKDKGVAGMDPIGKAHSHVQYGNKAQPKKGSGNKSFPGHREAGKK